MPTGNGSKEDKLPQTRASSARFSGDRMIVLLTGGRELSVPLADYPTLRGASTAERNDWELIGGGRAFHWEGLDLDLAVEALLHGLPERIPRPPAGKPPRVGSPSSALTSRHKPRRAG